MTKDWDRLARSTVGLWEIVKGLDAVEDGGAGLRVLNLGGEIGRHQERYGHAAHPHYLRAVSKRGKMMLEREREVLACRVTGARRKRFKAIVEAAKYRYKLGPMRGWRVSWGVGRLTGEDGQLVLCEGRGKRVGRVEKKYFLPAAPPGGPDDAGTSGLADSATSVPARGLLSRYQSCAFSTEEPLRCARHTSLSFYGEVLAIPSVTRIRRYRTMDLLVDLLVGDLLGGMMGPGGSVPAGATRPFAWVAMRSPHSSRPGHRFLEAIARRPGRLASGCRRWTRCRKMAACTAA